MGEGKIFGFIPLRLGFFLFSLFFSLFCFWGNFLYASIPHEIHYQGKISTVDNTPLSPGTYKITIRIYDQESGGTPIWQETHEVYIDTTGYFHINLGEITPLNLDFTQPYWMSVEINSDGEMSPRIPLLSVGYSINSERLGGIKPEQFLRSDVDDVMDANLTIRGNTTMQSSLTFSGPSVDITASSGENLTLKSADNAGLVMDISASSATFKITNGSIDIVKVDNQGNVTFNCKDDDKVVKIYPGNLLVGKSAPTGFFSGGDVYICGNLHVDGSVNFASTSGGSSILIDETSDEAFLVRKDNDTGDVFVVNTTNPEVEISSGTGTDATTRKSVKIYHDDTNGYITTNAGDLILDSATDIVDVAGTLHVASSIASTGGNLLLSASSGTVQVNSNLSVPTGLVMIGKGVINYLASDGSTAGDLYVAGDLEVDGSTWLGDDAAVDTLTVNGALNFNGDLNMANHRIINLSDPINLQDAATKSYVDTSITGAVSGTANYIAKFTAADKVGNSAIYQDPTTNYVGINDTAPGAQLSVKGSSEIDGDLTVSGNSELGDSSSDVTNIHGHIVELDTGYSVFLGEGAGQNDDLTDNNNVFIGYQSGYKNVNGSYNTALGYQSMYSNTLGAWNVSIGSLTLYSNTNGTNNVAVGDGSLYYNISGSYNVAIGKEVLNSNTNGWSNIGIGYHALYYNTLGYYNTAIGTGSLANNTVGNCNLCLGFDAGLAITGGSYNIMVGYKTAPENVSGDSQLNIGNTIKGNVLTSFDSVLYYDGLAFTDDTLEAKTTHGVAYTVLADTDDYFYIGSSQKFSQVYFELAQKGVGLSLSVEYFNGTSWVALTVTDGTSNLTQNGLIKFAIPSDWHQYSVNGAYNYWIRLKTSLAPTTIPMAYLTVRNGPKRFEIYSNEGDTIPAFAVDADNRVGIGVVPSKSTLEIKDMGLDTSSATNISATTVVLDQVKVDDYDTVTWKVIIKLGANRRVSIVNAVHNGTATADATVVNYAEYGVTTVGSFTTEPVVSVDLSGTGQNQVMRLKVTTTDVNVEAKAYRISL